MDLSVMVLADQITTETDAYRLLERLRWDDNPICPHCGSDRAYFLKPDNGIRKTRTGSPTERRLWKCGGCKKQYSVLTGTIFHGTKISIRKWLFVIFEMCASKNGVAAREIERKYHVTGKTAWFMLHRIREAMKREPLAGLLTGTIVADETYIGGKPRNKHASQKRSWSRKETAAKLDKTIVLSLVHKGTGEVRSHVVADVGGDTLRRVIAEQVNIPGSVLYTDAGKWYRNMGKEFIAHEWVDHGSDEYVRGEVSTNAAEGYFSQLKRSIDGTHHHVSRAHLARYLGEFDFRYSTCKLSDSARMHLLASQTEGRRLSYKQPTVQ